MSHTETSIASARASVMIYDDSNKKWVASGSSLGLSRVHIYHNTQNNTFRVVGRKIADHEVVINCAILKNLKYNQATPIFHQWRENRQVYGLNFSGKDEADAFAHTMMKVIDLLNQNTYGSTKSQPVATTMAQPVYGHIGPPEEYGELRQNGWHNPHNSHINNMEQNNAIPMNVNNVPMMHSQLMPELQMNNTGGGGAGAGPVPTIISNQSLNVSQPPPTYMSSGHLMQIRNTIPNSNPNAIAQVTTSMSQCQIQPGQSIPPPPPLPTSNTNMMPNNIMNGNQNGGTGMAAAAPPPPPPPPPPPSSTLSNTSSGSRLPPTNGGQVMNSNPTTSVPNGPMNFATAIANVRLKRTTSMRGEDNENNTTVSNNNSAARSAVPGNFMDEMAKTLARRRAQAESNQQQNQSNDNERNTNNSKTALVNGYSPSKDDNSSKDHRRHDDSKLSGITETDLERLKTEIMNDIRKELQKIKMDIVDALKMELNRR